MEKEFKYTAFISYNSKDNHKAKWLQKRLENYSLPSVIANEKGEVLRSYDKKPKKFRIFRYVTDLVAQNLDDGLRRELDQSKYLIVVCSPNSANAPWVRREVKHFIDTDRKKQIIPFVVKGKSYSGDEDECLTPELKDAFPRGSVLGVLLNDCGDDLWIFRKPKAIAKLVSLLIEIPNSYEYLWNRYKLSLIYKVILYVFLLVLFCISILLVRNYSKEFASEISLNEKIIYNNLPVINGTLSIIYGNEQKHYEIEDKIVVYDIARKYYGKDANLKIHAEAYKSIDTILKLEKKIVLNIQRDSLYYGNVYFKVVDALTDSIVSGCSVFVEDIECCSDSNGVVRVYIPLQLQRRYYKVSSRDVYVLTDTICPPFLESNIIEIINK